MDEKSGFAKRERTTAREELAKKLIAMAEGGQAGWQRGWRLMARNRAMNALSGRPYSGGNQLNLRIGTLLNQATWYSPGWLTARQIQEAGGRLRKDDDSTPRCIEFWRTSEFWEHRNPGLMTFIDGRLGKVIGLDQRGVEVKKEGDSASMFVPVAQADDRIAVRQNLLGTNAKRLTFTQARQEFSSLICVNYLVYNLEQCEGIAREKLHRSLRLDAVDNAAWRAQLQGLSDMTALLEGKDTKPVSLSTDPKPAGITVWDRVDALLAGMQANGLKVVHTPSNQPRYSIRSDTVYMPEREQFKTPHAYVSTLVHELAHASGAGHRLGRFVGGVWGGESDVHEYEVTESRAKEEMIAEMASAMVCSDIGANYEMTATAGYLQSWMEVLKNGPGAAYTAAKDAQSAADFLMHAMESQLALRAHALQGKPLDGAPEAAMVGPDDENDFEMAP